LTVRVAEEELLGDLRVRQSAGEVAEDVELARREVVELGRPGLWRDEPEPGAHERLVIGDQDADAHSGRRALTR
jgi:hypothetical protein